MAEKHKRMAFSHIRGRRSIFRAVHSSGFVAGFRMSNAGRQGPAGSIRNSELIAEKHGGRPS